MASHLENERELLALAKQGDQQAFTTLVKQYEKNIYRLTFNFVREHSAAEDLMQETFLRAYVSLAKFQGDSRFYTWLVRIAVNCALMELRTRRRRAKTISLDEGQDGESFELPRAIEDWKGNPEEAYSNTELKRILDEALSRLEPDYRTVVFLRDVEGYSTEETAAMLQISISATKSRLLRARLQLREYLNEHFRQTPQDETNRSLGEVSEGAAAFDGLLPVQAS